MPCRSGTRDARPKTSRLEAGLCMFDGRAFRTWLHILVGAVAFAGLFMTVVMMSELVFSGRFQMTRAVAGIGTGAFIGYVATAWLVRPASVAP